MIVDIINYWQWYVGIIVIYGVIAAYLSMKYLNSLAMTDIAKMVIMTFIVVNMALSFFNLFEGGIGWWWYAMYPIAKIALFKQEREMV